MASRTRMSDGDHHCAFDRRQRSPTAETTGGTGRRLSPHAPDSGHHEAASDIGGERWATLISIIETCKLNHVEPYGYLHEVLQRMVDGYPVNRLDELLPWNWKPPEAVKN